MLIKFCLLAEYKRYKSFLSHYIICYINKLNKHLKVKVEKIFILAQTVYKSYYSNSEEINKQFNAPYVIIAKSVPNLSIH